MVVGVVVGEKVVRGGGGGNFGRKGSGSGL